MTKEQLALRQLYTNSQDLAHALYRKLEQFKVVNWSLLISFKKYLYGNLDHSLNTTTEYNLG